MSAGIRPAPQWDIEHIKIIQSVISRMAQNSFQAKAWSIALVGAILAVSGRLDQFPMSVIALLPASCFWLIDAYYLRQERLFRELYKEAANPTSQIQRFSMDVTPYENCVASWAKTMFTPAVFLIHGMIFAVIAVVVTAFVITQLLKG